MKNHLCYRLIAVLLLCAAAMSCLASCGAAATALPGKAKVSAIFRQAEKNTNRAKSITSETNMTLSWRLQGQLCRVSSYAAVKLQQEPALRTVTTTSVSGTVAGQSVTSRRSTYGYMDGKAFVSIVRGVYSEMTETEYLKWQAKRMADDEFSFSTNSLLAVPGGCGVRECTTDEETGGYVLTFREVGKKNLNAFSGMTKSLSEALPDVTLSDVELTAWVTSALTFSKIEIRFVFDGAEEKDGIDCLLTAKFTDLNATEVPDEQFDRYYSQVDDVRDLDMITDAYNDFMDSTDANVTVTTSTTVKIAGQNQNSEETDKIHVARKDGKFSFEIDAEADSAAYVFTYADGKMHGKSKYATVDPDPEDCTESEAVAYIRSLVDPLTFDPSFASDMETLDEHTFTVTLQSDALASIRQGLQAGGLSVRSSAGSIRVELDDDGSVKKTTLTCSFDIGVSAGYNSYTGTAKIVYTCGFD